MNKAYKIRLYPNQAQRDLIDKTMFINAIAGIKSIEI